MTIDLKTIKHISKLSRISVDEKKAEKLAGDLNSIFDFIKKLNELKDLKYVGDVRGGKGLLATVELVKDKKTKESFDESKNLYGIMPKFLKDNGLLSYRAGDLISVCPPLLINKDEIDFIVEGIRSSITELEKI